MSTLAILTGLDLLLQLLDRTSSVAAIIRQARSEGRTELTLGELESIKAQGDALMLDLEAAIQKAKSEGR